jgi:hypothetical protein
MQFSLRSPSSENSADSNGFGLNDQGGEDKVKINMQNSSILSNSPATSRVSKRVSDNNPKEMSFCQQQQQSTDDISQMNGSGIGLYEQQSNSIAGNDIETFGLTFSFGNLANLFRKNVRKKRLRI